MLQLFCEENRYKINFQNDGDAHFVFNNMHYFHIVRAPLERRRIKSKRFHHGVPAPAGWFWDDDNFLKLLHINLYRLSHIRARQCHEMVQFGITIADHSGSLNRIISEALGFEFYSCFVGFGNCKCLFS